MALSDAAIRKAKPADKPLRLFDGGGLYLEISPSGSKLWRLKYRFPGREKRLALGIYPDVSLAGAREGRGAHDTAHTALQNCGQVFRYGVANGANPQRPLPLSSRRVTLSEACALPVHHRARGGGDPE